MKTRHLRDHFWEQAPMFRLLLPLAAGIFLYDLYYRHPLSLSVQLGLLSACFLLCLLLQVSGKGRRFKLLYFFSVQLFLAATGYTCYYMCDQRHHADWYGNKQESYTLAQAVLLRDPLVKSSSTRLELSLFRGITETGRQEPISGKGLLYLYGAAPGAPSLFKGDTVLVPCRWQPIRNAGNPFEFDYARWCRRKNIHYRQFCNWSAIYPAGKRSPGSISFIERSHEYCLRSIESYVKDTATSALLKAVIAGDESDIDPELRQAYSDTGIIHIISVSGSHVNLLFLGLAFLLRFIRRARYRWIQFAAGFLLVWFYVLMAGAAAPAIRAALMFTIVATGSLLQRSANPLNQLCTAAFVMLLYEPAWLFAAGFQLSFLAILSITLFYAPLRDLLRPKHKVLNWLWQSVALSLAAEILIAPLVAFYFHSFPASFLVSNIIACLVMSAILVLGILLVLLAPVAPLAMALAWLITRITVLFHQCILFLQGFSPAVFKQLQLALPQLLLLYIFIAATAIFLAGRKKKAIWPAMAALLLFALYGLHSAWQTATMSTFIVYNHKSGQAELLQSGTYHWLCGDTTESTAAKTAHIGYHCNRRSLAPPQELILAGGKRILLPGRHMNPANPFPADVVVLTAVADVALIKEKFRPQLVVLGGSLSRKQALQLKEQCGREGLACHDTREKGAYLLY